MQLEGVMMQDARNLVSQFVEHSQVPISIKMNNFPVYSNRQAIARFLALSSLYQLQRNIKGSIVEGGVYQGAGTFTYAHLAEIFEPSNYHRQIIGFDTFDGFPSTVPLDEVGVESIGSFKPAYDTYQELNHANEVFQRNSLLDAKARIKLIKGDATITMPKFIQDNPWFVCSMLYLDFDIYEPTRIGLETFLPRMPRGAVIAFDEIHNPNWAGETKAVLDTIGIKNLKLQSFEFEPHVSYAIIE